MYDEVCGVLHCLLPHKSPLNNEEGSMAVHFSHIHKEGTRCVDMIAL